MLVVAHTHTFSPTDNRTHLTTSSVAVIVCIFNHVPALYTIIAASTIWGWDSFCSVLSIGWLQFKGGN